jgi:hypothetical protein
MYAHFLSKKNINKIDIAIMERTNIGTPGGIVVLKSKKIHE